jgi:hypothetical protein
MLAWSWWRDSSGKWMYHWTDFFEMSMGSRNLSILSCRREQLVSEVKGIYAGLVMVYKKYCETRNVAKSQTQKPKFIRISSSQS